MRLADTRTWFCGDLFLCWLDVRTTLLFRWRISHLRVYRYAGAASAKDTHILLAGRWFLSLGFDLFGDVIVAHWVIMLQCCSMALDCVQITVSSSGWGVWPSQVQTNTQTTTCTCCDDDGGLNFRVKYVPNLDYSWCNWPQHTSRRATLPSQTSCSSSWRYVIQLHAAMPAQCVSGDPAAIHPFLAEIGKDGGWDWHRGSSIASGSEMCFRLGWLASLGAGADCNEHDTSQP